MDEPGAAFAVYALIVVAFVAVAYAMYDPGLRTAVPVRQLPFALAAVVAAYVIAAVLVRSASNADIINFQYTARLVRDGHYIYSAPLPPGSFFAFHFHPYLPSQLFLVAAADWLREAIALPFSVGIKLPSILAAAVTAILLRSAGQRLWDAPTAAVVALAFILNPVVVDFTAYHGQFDAIPTVLALGAWYKLRFSASRQDELASAALLGAGILSKTWPIALLPLFAFSILPRRREAIAYVGVALAIPLAAALAYAAALRGSLADMADVVGRYQGVIGLGGYSVLVARAPGSQADVTARLGWIIDYGPYIFRAGMLSVVAIVLWRFAGDLAAAATTILVALYVFAPASGPQYYVWIVPFALLSGQRLFPIAMALMYGLLNVLLLYANVHTVPPWIVRDAGHAAESVWAVGVAWLVWCLYCTVRPASEAAAAAA